YVPRGMDHAGSHQMSASLARRLRLTFALRFAPAASTVVGNDVLEHSAEGRRIDGLALADSNGAGSFVVVPSGDDAVGIRNDAAVVDEYVHVVPGREQRAD